MKHYAKKREPVRAAQWTGEMTPEMKELLGERPISIDGDRQLVFANAKGPGRFARVGDWIVSFSGEDLGLVGADEFRDAYEEAAERDVSAMGRAAQQRSSLRTCPGCDRRFAMLYICERCGRCDAQDLPRDADRDACCAGDDTCVERDWRSEVVPMGPHITEQVWLPEVRDDGVYLIGADDHTVILKLCRPDRSSDLLLAGYISGLQGMKVPRKASP